jgi:hypothetical protein
VVVAVFLLKTEVVKTVQVGVAAVVAVVGPLAALAALAAVERAAFPAPCCSAGNVKARA